MNPFMNLPFFLQAIGKGSQGFAQGVNAADEHKRNLIQMGLMQQQEADRQSENQRADERLGLEKNRFGLEQERFNADALVRRMNQARFERENAPNPVLNRLLKDKTGTDFGDMPEYEAIKTGGIVSNFAQQEATRNYRQKELEYRQNALNASESKARLEDLRHEWDRHTATLNAYRTANINKYQANDPDVAAEIIRLQKKADDAQKSYEQARKDHTSNFGSIGSPFSTDSSGSIDLGEPDSLPQENYDEEN